MEASVHCLSNLESDCPIALLTRRRIRGEQILFAEVRLEKGCHVAFHQHPSEQISYLVSGKVKWTLGENREERIISPGEVVLLPGDVPHAVDALEDSIIIDILSPPAAMGVDSQDKTS